MACSDIRPLRPFDYAKVSFKKGQLVQLQDFDSYNLATTPANSINRCLGNLHDKRWGVVLLSGVVRGGIERNILVASDDHESAENKPRISAYSANELMLASRR